MNVREMHLAIRQGVDKINSLQADMLLSQEIDIELNKSMFRFVNTKYGRNNLYRQGFEQSQKRIDDLRTLVTEFEEPVTYKGPHDSNFFIDQFRLPNDYLYLVNQKSILYTSNDCETIQYNLDNSSPLSYFVFPLEYLYLDLETNKPVIETSGFNDPYNSPGGFVKNLAMLADLDDYTLGFSYPFAPITISPYNYPQDLETLRLDILDSTNWGAGFEWHWEQFGEINAPNSFIVTVDTTQHTYFNWDLSTGSPITQLIGVHNPISGANPSSISSWSKVNAQYTDSYAVAKRIVSSNAERSVAFNKFVQQDDIFKLLDDPFNTTKHTSPLTTIRGNYIDIYTSDIFIIDKVKITYIRKPKEISLTLDKSCELPVHTHQEIVAMAISSILEGLNDPRYSTHQKEVIKNE
jgi:hypothetical protein